MTDRKQNQNQPTSDQQSPHPTRDDENWDKASGGRSSERERSSREPASVAGDRGNIGERDRGTGGSDLDESQLESGMDDPVSGTNRSRDREKKDLDRSTN